MSLTSQIERLKARKANGLVEGATNILGTALVMVARKTGKLEGALGISTMVKEGSNYRVDVGVLNYEVPYANIVEKGVPGKFFDYHRDGSVVYVGMGQYFLRRALDENRADLLKIIRTI